MTGWLFSICFCGPDQFSSTQSATLGRLHQVPVKSFLLLDKAIKLSPAPNYRGGKGETSSLNTLVWISQLFSGCSEYGYFATAALPFHPAKSWRYKPLKRHEHQGQPEND